MLRLHEVNKVYLSVCWVDFELIDDWFDATVTEKVCEQLKVKVTDTNRAYEARIDQRFQLFIYDMDRYSVRRILLEVPSWPMDHVAVEVFNL